MIVIKKEENQLAKRSLFPTTKVTIFLPTRVKEDFFNVLAREGIDPTTFLISSTYQWVEEMEQKIREGKVKKVPTEYVRRESKEQMTQIQVVISKTLKQRLDRCLEYTPDTRNELWVNWIQKFVRKKSE
jgi:hypothetical protein